MSQPLTIAFHSDTSEARNAIAQLAATITANMVNVGNSMKAANDNVNEFTSKIRSLPVSLGVALAAIVAFRVAVEAVEKAVSTAAEQIKKLQDIQKGSEAAGVSSTFYQDQVRDLQRFGMTAEEAAKSLIKAKEALSGRVDEKGGFQEAGIFKQLGELRDTGFKGLDNPLNQILGAAPNDIETRIRAARDAMKQLHDDAEATGKVNLEALADQIGRALGYSQDATNEVKKLGDAATQTGNNFEEGLVKQSKELDQKIADVHLKLSNDMQPIMTDLARLGLMFKDAWYGTLTPVENFIGAIGRAYGRMKQLADERDRMGQGGELTIPGARQSFRTPAARRGVAGRTAFESTQDLAEGTGDAQTQASLETRAELAGLPGPGGPIPTPTARPPDLGKKEKTETDPTEALDTYMDALRKSVVVLEAEVRTFGLSNTEKARDIDLTKAQDAARKDAEDGKRTSKELTEEETKAVLAQADAQGKAKDSLEALQRVQSAANEQAQLLGNQLLSAFDKIGTSGARVTDIVKDMARALLKAAEQALILGTGPFANLFGTFGTQGQPGGLAGLLVGGAGKLFGGLGSTDFEGAGGQVASMAEDVITEIDAEGGVVGQGRFKKYMPRSAFIGAPSFASGGVTPALLHPGEIVMNAAQQRNVAGSMGGHRSINITHAPVINGTGLSKEELFSVLQRDQKELHRNIGALMQDWQRRYA
jgi:hypothetical protein